MDKWIFRKTDLSWIVDYDYDRSTCTCNAYERGDYCRCTSIINTRIDKVNVREVVDELYNRHSRTDEDVDEYCFDRICHAFNIYDKYLYEIETCGGYYGEEIKGVYFENEEKVFNAYYEMLELKTPLEKIQYCLKLEYGYLLDCVESVASADIIEVPTDKICPPQKEYFIKVDKSVIEEYKNRDLPVAVCVVDGNRYRLIDGYHRFVANNDKDRVKIIVLK